LFLMTLGRKLCLSPVGENPQHVLDIGTGTGLWAMDFGSISLLHLQVLSD